MEKKVSILGSLRTKLILALLIVGFATGGLMLLTLLPHNREIISEINSHYIEDVAISYGTMIDIQLETDTKENVLDADVMKHDLEGAHIEGMESSYAYVVSPDGVMLYHPTADKIGKPVENEAVKKTVETIKAGKEVKNEVIEYEFKGEMKYAGIYVNDTQDYILVVTVDKDEILASFNEARRWGFIAWGLAMIGVVILGILFSAILIKPINQLSNVVLRLADMNFTENEVQTKINNRKDETGRMGRALDTLRLALVNIVSDIKNKS